MFFYIVHDGATGDIWVHIYSCAYLIKGSGHWLNRIGL